MTKRGDARRSAKKLFPHHSLPHWGKAKRRRLRRPKRKPTPPRCARQPLPREGARVDTPSFLWKEVPRRGGGWMGNRDERERGRSSQVRRLREHPIHHCAVPLPQWGRLRYEDTAFLDTTPFPRGKAKRRRLRREYIWGDARRSAESRFPVKAFLISFV